MIGCPDSYTQGFSSRVHLREQQTETHHMTDLRKGRGQAMSSTSLVSYVERKQGRKTTICLVEEYSVSLVGWMCLRVLDRVTVATGQNTLETKKCSTFPKPFENKKRFPRPEELLRVYVENRS